jgi:hypothetical protein
VETGEQLLGVPITMKLRDSNGDLLAVNTEMRAEVKLAGHSDPIAVSERVEDISSWNTLSITEQRKNDYIDAVKLLLQQAKEAGLEDDPAVEALEKRAQMLLVDNGLTPDPTASAQLAEEYGADASMLESLSDDDCEALLEHLSMAEEIGDSDGRLAEKEITRRFEETQALLAQNNVQVRDLFQAEARGLEGELSAALSRGAEFDDDDVAVDASSDRVRKAQLQDNLSEIDDRLESADHPFMKHSLREERSAVEARLADLDVGESNDSTDSDHPFSR